VQGADQPAQRLFQVGALLLAERVVQIRCRLAGRLDLAVLDRQQRLQVLAQPFGKAVQQRTHPVAQPRQLGGVQVVVGAHLVGQPIQQRQFVGDREHRVDGRAVPGEQLAGLGAAVQSGDRQLDAGGLAEHRALVGGEHDLVGHRRQVDLVGLLVQVVLLGQVLRVEELPDVGGFAVGMPLLGGTGRLVTESHLVGSPGVVEVVVGVPVACVAVVQHRPEPEEGVEDPVEGGQIPAVFDHRDGQPVMQEIAVGE
jgi:hypothetical protein